MLNKVDWNGRCETPAESECLEATLEFMIIGVCLQSDAFLKGCVFYVFNHHNLHMQI